MTMTQRLFAAAAVLPGSMGHAEITWPPALTQGNMDKAGTCEGPDISRMPQNGTCLWLNDGCTIGCPACVGRQPGTFAGSLCGRPGSASLDDRYRTIFNAPAGTDPTAEFPWRAPGTAPVWSPCGVAGGSVNATWTPDGIKAGFDGRHLPRSPGPRTLWDAGSVQEVAWSMRANHGGGYSWRLCPRSENISDMSEECFQRQQLDFVGDVTWIQYGGSKANRTAVHAVRVVDGTFPAGSMWTRNPIPTCSGAYNGDRVAVGCDKPMFPPPMDVEDLPGVAQQGLYGYGQAACEERLRGHECSAEENEFWRRRFNFNLVDLVQVPMLPPADYVLAFRWDVEQIPQIWSVCADVTIVAPDIHV